MIESLPSFSNCKKTSDLYISFALERTYLDVVHTENQREVYEFLAIPGGKRALRDREGRKETVDSTDDAV